MCGIIGYIGDKNATEVLLVGLKFMEYRGYDSAGVALLYPEGIKVFKEKGKLRALEGAIPEDNPAAKMGIGHIRWATHGEPSKLNAHPISNEDGTITVVHNGIIENHEAIKTMLTKEGYTFITRLIQKFWLIYSINIWTGTRLPQYLWHLTLLKELMVFVFY